MARTKRLTKRQKRLAEEAVSLIPGAIQGFRLAYPGVGGKLARIDAVSVANLAIVTAARTYDEALSKPTTYFTRAVHHALLKELHREKRLGYCHPDRVPLETAERKQDCEVWKSDLYVAYLLLGEDERQLVRSRYFEQKTFEQIASDLGCDRRTVKRRLEDALRSLGASDNDVDEQ